MAQLDKDDLKQMNRSYFQSLSQERLVEVADNLHQLATELWEKQQQNSENSSQPPSKDNPDSSTATTEESAQNSAEETWSAETEQKQIDESSGKPNPKKSPQKPGKQPGAKGFGRSQLLKAEVIVPHYPLVCSACNDDLAESDSQRYMGHYVLELEPELFGFRIVTSLHHYYRTTCGCGHCTQAKPGTGYISVVEGRSKDLQLTEYVLVGAFLATFIASLGVRYRMSRTKIQEFFKDWTNTKLSVGWLISDGYAAYRSHPKRQRCLAHLIRKAIAITGAINQKAAQIGQWILDDLRELMATIASDSGDNRWLRKLLARLIRVCHLGQKADHHKLQALAKEILNDWDAVVAFVKNPELPPTNNEAERALRHAVIARNIGFGTRTHEGSLAYSSLLSVIENSTKTIN